ncbi:Vesicular glutamate transporter 2 [Zootermopsis nevadensis]|uniref:Vesicular glutamate transporter 2 n=1 Tax=Zootermopsis nevadensis TaxID=136037 RepID=A0A067RJZ8_ZOONE|nr:Vesicular glutamate transporter 2 [Zootermopsis nevadensis]
MTTYHGSAVGTALTYPLSGLLMAVLDWQYVFYVTGALTLTWYAFWWYLVYDSPAQHPRISDAERKYLERVIGDSVASHKVFEKF